MAEDKVNINSVPDVPYFGVTMKVMLVVIFLGLGYLLGVNSAKKSGEIYQTQSDKCSPDILLVPPEVLRAKAD